MQTIRKVFNQTFWQVLGKAVNALTTLLVLSAITRSYGEEGTGINTLSLTYLTFFYLAADFGLNAHFLSKIEKHPKDINKLFNTRLAWSLLLGCLAISLIPIFPFSNYAVVMSVIFGAGSIVFSGIFSSANLVFQHYHVYKYSAIASIANGLVLLPIVLVLIKRGAAVEYLSLGTLLGWAATSLAALYLVRKLHKFRIGVLDTKFILETLRKTWPISVTLIINTIYFRVDAFILSSYYSFKEVGNYNLAYLVFADVIVLATFIMNGFYPIMLKSLKESRKLFFYQFKNAVLLMLGLGALGSIFGWFFAPFIVKILSGEGFSGSVDVLRILSYSYPAFFLSSLLIWTMILFNKSKLMLGVYIMGFFANLLANLIFIPRYSFYGAAWVTVLGECLILLLQIIILIPAFKERRI